MHPDPSESFFARHKKKLPDLRVDSAFLRRAARWGAVTGPDAFVRYSPPIIGGAFALALPETRRRVAENLRWVGAKGTLAETMEVFSKYALCLTEAFSSGAGRDRIVARVHGDQNFQTARALGRGVIIATAHTSGWYAAGPILGSVYEDEVMMVMQSERDFDAQQLQDQAKEQLGLKVVHVGGSDPLAAMPLLTHLRRGGVVALQMDRVPAGQRGVTVELAGRPFLVPEGPLILAGLSGAPIAVILGRRVGTLAYDLEVGEPIRIGRKAPRGEIEACARQLAGQIDQFVRRHPTDWFHFG